MTAAPSVSSLPKDVGRVRVIFDPTANELSVRLDLCDTGFLFDLVSARRLGEMLVTSCDDALAMLRGAN